MVSLSHFFLELIKHKVVYLISSLSKVLDCHFNLLEPIWMHKIVAWTFFVFIPLPRNEKQAAHVFGLMHALIWLNFVVALLCTLSNFCFEQFAQKCLF
jgi:hypothetical protein